MAGARDKRQVSCLRVLLSGALSRCLHIQAQGLTVIPQVQVVREMCQSLEFNFDVVCTAIWGILMRRLQLLQIISSTSQSPGGHPVNLKKHSKPQHISLSSCALQGGFNMHVPITHRLAHHTGATNVRTRRNIPYMGAAQLLRHLQLNALSVKNCSQPRWQQRPAGDGAQHSAAADGVPPPRGGARPPPLWQPLWSRTPPACAAQSPPAHACPVQRIQEIARIVGTLVI